MNPKSRVSLSSKEAMKMHEEFSEELDEADQIHAARKRVSLDVDNEGVRHQYRDLYDRQLPFPDPDQDRLGSPRANQQQPADVLRSRLYQRASLDIDDEDIRKQFQASSSDDDIKAATIPGEDLADELRRVKAELKETKETLNLVLLHSP